MICIFVAIKGDNYSNMHFEKYAGEIMCRTIKLQKLITATNLLYKNSLIKG